MNKNCPKFLWELVEKGFISDNTDADGTENVPSFFEIAKERAPHYFDEIKIFVGAIIDAGKKREMKYFNSESFYLHCRLTGLSPQQVAKIFTEIWGTEDDTNAIS